MLIENDFNAFLEEKVSNVSNLQWRNEKSGQWQGKIPEQIFRSYLCALNITLLPLSPRFLRANLIRLSGDVVPLAPKVPLGARAARNEFARVQIEKTWPQHKGLYCNASYKHFNH